MMGLQVAAENSKRVEKIWCEKWTYLLNTGCLVGGGVGGVLVTSLTEVNKNFLKSKLVSKCICCACDESSLVILNRDPICAEALTHFELEKNFWGKSHLIMGSIMSRQTYTVLQTKQYGYSADISNSSFVLGSFVVASSHILGAFLFFERESFLKDM